MEEKTTINKSYIFTQKELKTLLGIKGDIIQITLYQGLSPKEQELNHSKDFCSYEIITQSKEE
jgi:hypothetical protein